MYKYIFSFIFIPILFVALATPAMASSNTRYYANNANQQQQIANLYALIAQLQAQLAALQSYNPVINPPYQSGVTQSSSEITRVVTGSVDGDGDDAATMEGEVTFRRDGEARVWFEYGTNTNLSYSTESLELDGDAGDTEDFEITALDLGGNKTYYYRAVAQDDNGRYVEGSIKSFRFDGRNNDDDDDDDDNDSDNDWSLEVDDDYYESGDTVRVDYEVEDKDSDNWIGLYKVGARDANYLAYKYISKSEGYVTFRIYDEGEYEFRMFDQDDDQVAESDEFEVED